MAKKKSDETRPGQETSNSRTITCTDCGVQGPVCFGGKEPQEAAADDGWRSRPLDGSGNQHTMICPDCYIRYFNKTSDVKLERSSSIVFPRDERGLSRLATFLGALQREKVAYEMRQEFTGRILVRVV
jgi:hypothetical protein